jgi:hypothetical protein
MAAGERISGERFLGPGSEIGRGKKGKEERRLRDLYRHGAGMKWQEVKRIKEGGMALSPGVILGWRLKTKTALTGGARCQREREKESTTLGEAMLGRGLVSSLGRKGYLGPFHIFFPFLPFLFLFSHFFYNFCILASI